MRTNKAPRGTNLKTHGGAKAAPGNPISELRRAVLANLLWEDQFYEKGSSIAQRIADLVKICAPADVSELAIEARTAFSLRHTPLFLVLQMARLETHRYLVRETLYQVIQRPDEITEFMALYWKEGRVPIANQVKKGLRAAFGKFDAYQLAKYNRDTEVKLRDVAFLVHATPGSQTTMGNTVATTGIRRPDYRRGPTYRHKGAPLDALVNGELETPDTWETELSAGADKKATFERLIKERKLGYMALLRNLRGMTEARVDPELIKLAISQRQGAKHVLPFRYYQAATEAPRYERELDEAMIAALKLEQTRLPGKTVIVVDVSGSMYGMKVSQKSTLTRAQGACALAAVIRGVCEDVVVFATGGSDAQKKHATKEVPAREGMALIDAIFNMREPLGGGGVFLNQVMRHLKELRATEGATRVIVITDEQDCGGPEDSPSKAPTIGQHNYILNVGSYANGINFGAWTTITGFSQQIVRFIAASEGAHLQDQ